MGIGMTKQEAMKRYLRGDFDTLDKLANNPHGNTGAIYWFMRDKGWRIAQGAHGSVVVRDMTGNGAYATEGGPEWHVDLQEVLKEIKYVNT